MSIEPILGITTIDDLDTKRREDGFLIDLKTGIIQLATVIPNFSDDAIARARESIFTKHEGRYGVGKYFPREKGFQPTVEKNALILSMFPPYAKGKVRIGKAVILQKFDSRFANLHFSTDPHLKGIASFVSREIKSPINSGTVVRYLLQKFNSSCAEVMMSMDLPHLFREGGKVSNSGGIFTINKPMRDAVSFFNCLQFVHFLEHNEVAFTSGELSSLLSLKYST